ncbi:enolase C-terminal domain-like protein [Nakamurella aerolata]|uniref:Mandelate racemase/muconate lactonizing enzyme family protein n=1 Tax=Nakamurella aerolata TaxID=1656892 RepID=A0A849A5V8_9ACTN|nr:mandelate racemase/muconate lactonizing enzyme family protein [Nakamurella aerolata]
MRITDLRPVLLTGPISDDPSMLEFRTLRSAALVELHTDAGVVGVGETYLGYHLPQVVAPLIEYYAPILRGQALDDPADIAALSNAMATCGQFWGRVGVGPTVISAVQGAMFDALGKLRQVPAYELLGGGRHDRLLGYATGGASNWPMDALKQKVDRYLDAGFRAFKLGAGRFVTEPDGSRRQISVGDSPAHTAQLEADKVAAIRDYVGPDVGIMLDAHMGFRSEGSRWNLETATAVLDAVAPYQLIFFEEALPYNGSDGLTGPQAYAELTARTATPVAGGEQLTTAVEFAPFAGSDGSAGSAAAPASFDIAQPDAAWLSMTDFVAVATAFAARGARVASHAWSGGVGVMQNLHAAFACANTAVVEIPPLGGALHTRLWGDSLRLDADGYVLAPTEPGLGVRLDDAVKAEFPFRQGYEEWVDVPGKIMPTSDDEASRAGSTR